MRFDCAGPHKVWAVALGCGIFSVNFRVNKWLLWNLDTCFDCAGSHKVYAVVFGCGIFPVNFRVNKWLLWNLDTRFDCAGSHKVCAVVLGCGIFPVNFCIKLLVKFWHAFRPCRLAQNVCPGSGLNLGRNIFSVSFRLNWLLWNLDMRFDCVGSRKVWS